MIADTLAAHIGTIGALMALVRAVRPLNAGIDDAFPFLAYETTGFTNLSRLNGVSPWYEGVVRLHACAINWDDVNAIVESIKANVIGTQAAGDVYAITRIKYDDESDMSIAGAEHENAYYVRTVDLFVRARKL